MSRTVVRGALVALTVACAALAGCQTVHRVFGNKQTRKPVTAESLYKDAHKRLLAYDYNGAVKEYEALTARFPFTNEARQARIDLIYAYYRKGEEESAIDAADTFIRENPTHPRVDYAWYIKGLVDFERKPNALERLFHADLTKRPPTNAKKSFDAFRTVVEQYPKSIYAHDARQRMIYLRNRLADYDVHVAKYYMRRGAYIGAAQRANHAIEEYDGAPAVQQALEIMTNAYQKVGLNERADLSEKVLVANRASFSPPETRVASNGSSRHWWHIW